MAKLSVSQRGAVGAVEIALVVVLLAAGGFVTWRITSADKAVNESAQNADSASNSTAPTSAHTEKKTDETKPDPYKGWGTFASATYKFSFRYPTNMKTVEPSSKQYDVLGFKPGNFLDFGTVKFKDAASEHSYIQVVVQPGKPDTNSFQNLYGTLEQKSMTKLTVAGKTAYSALAGDGGSGGDMVRIPGTDAMVLLWFVGDTDQQGGNKVKDYQAKILSSFKFTE